MSEILTETTEEVFDFPEFPEIEEPVNQFYVELNEENRITSVQSIKVNDNMFLFTLPADFDIAQHINYKIVDGELVEDPFVYPEIEVAPSTEEDLMAMAVDHEYRLTMLELGVM